MTVSVRYIKRNKFNTDKSLLINPKHVFNFNGYTSVITTYKTAESINPLDFESKYSVNDYKTAIKSKLISDTFATLKVEKFDKVMALIFLNVITLIAIVYLIYNTVEGVKI